MPKFSTESLVKLSSCHPDLHKIFKIAIEHIDFRITEGHRGQAAQDKAFAEGNSKVKWPNGNHNASPSLAVDALILPVDFDTSKPNNLGRYYFFAGLIRGIAIANNIKIKWGGDWDNDNDFSDEKFRDLVHFELIK